MSKQKEEEIAIARESALTCRTVLEMLKENKLLKEHLDLAEYKLLKDLQTELETLREERDKWKDEYQNLCKFATDYEQQRDALRAENVRMAEALTLSVKAMRIISDWDSSFPEGLQIDDQWIRPYEILKKIEEALAQSPKSQSLVEVEQVKEELLNQFEDSIQYIPNWNSKHFYAALKNSREEFFKIKKKAGLE